MSFHNLYLHITIPPGDCKNATTLIVEGSTLEKKRQLQKKSNTMKTNLIGRPGCRLLIATLAILSISHIPRALAAGPIDYGADPHIRAQQAVGLLHEGQYQAGETTFAWQYDDVYYIAACECIVGENDTTTIIIGDRHATSIDTGVYNASPPEMNSGLLALIASFNTGASIHAPPSPGSVDLLI